MVFLEKEMSTEISEDLSLVKISKGTSFFEVNTEHTRSSEISESQLSSEISEGKHIVNCLPKFRKTLRLPEQTNNFRHKISTDNPNTKISDSNSSTDISEELPSLLHPK